MTDSSILEPLHPGHHSIRLKNVDYSRPGFYLVTVCSTERRCIFGDVCDAQLMLNALGRLARECWVQIPVHFPGVTLLDFVVMPNHIHGIIELGGQPGRGDTLSLHGEGRVARVAAGSLGAIIRSFKSAVTQKAHKELNLPGEVWQRNYYETVLRPGKELGNARAYVKENPQKWEWDRENPSSHRR